ncbi:DNA alkylation repair protein [bacterium]|nr:DNA alkylation repair protein [bacterium]
MDYDELIARLKSMENPKNVAGMARFGINSKDTLGISVVTLRKIAREVGKDHALALKLWPSGIHEARLLACFIAEPKKVTPSLMNRWAKDFDSWDVCDQCCMNLFDKTPYAYEKVKEWSQRKEEFVKRAAFALMAGLAVHDKDASNANFQRFFPIIKAAATDTRNYVKKAVNWALRQIGKRNAFLHRQAMRTAAEIAKLDSSSARWIAADAIRELKSKMRRA